MDVVAELGTVTIELYGVARVKAGREQCVVRAGTVREAIAKLADECPALVGSVIVDGCLHPAYRVSVNGLSFVADPNRPIGPGDSLLLIAADAGG